MTAIVFARGATVTNLLTQQQVEQLAIQAGFSRTPYPVLDNLPPYRVAAAISLCEGVTAASMAATIRDRKPYSDFDAVGDVKLQTTVWGPSIGGMQIRSLWSHKGTGDYRDELALRVPLNNLKAAYRIWLDARRRSNPPLINGKRNWTGFEPWSSFNNGLHRAYLQDVYKTADNAYMVVGGDTLSGIASKTGVATWPDWARVNDIQAPYTIYIGQVLQRPWFPHVVTAGETMASIAQGNHLLTARLREFNNLKTGQPAVGSTILIPHRLL